MNILLTNDDGVESGLLHILKEKLVSLGHDVYVIAPKTPKSCSSLSITSKKEMSLEKRDEKFFVLDGTPVDCVKVAFLGKLFGYVKFDAVVSGINKGFNITRDIFYSGTLGAAIEGFFFGASGVAFSSDAITEEDIVNNQQIINKNLDYIMNNILRKYVWDTKFLFNINFSSKKEVFTTRYMLPGIEKKLYSEKCTINNNSVILEGYIDKELYFTEYEFLNKGVVIVNNIGGILLNEC